MVDIKFSCVPISKSRFEIMVTFEIEVYLKYILFVSSSLVYFRFVKLSIRRIKIPWVFMTISSGSFLKQRLYFLISLTTCYETLNEVQLDTTFLGF